MLALVLGVAGCGGSGDGESDEPKDLTAAQVQANFEKAGVEVKTSEAGGGAGSPVPEDVKGGTFMNLSGGDLSDKVQNVAYVFKSPADAKKVYDGLDADEAELAEVRGNRLYRVIGAGVATSDDLDAVVNAGEGGSA